METCSVVLTFESVDKILHSNETSWAVLLHGTICLEFFFNFDFWHSCVKGSSTIKGSMQLMEPTMNGKNVVGMFTNLQSDL